MWPFKSKTKTLPTPRRHPSNVDGAFYSTIGCIQCGAPEATAPTLIGFTSGNGDGHCIVIKQPVTDSEIHNMVDAMNASCVDCYRYAGEDAKVIDLLCKSGMAHLIEPPTSDA